MHKHAFLKSFIQRKGEKSNVSVSWTTLCTQKIKICMQKVNFLENVCLSTKFGLRFNKKVQFQNKFQIAPNCELYDKLFCQ